MASFRLAFLPSKDAPRATRAAPRAPLPGLASISLTSRSAALSSAMRALFVGCRPLGTLGSDASIMSYHSVAGRTALPAFSSTSRSMDFCGNSMLPVGMGSLPVSVPSVPSAPEPCGVGRIEGGPCRLSAPESWIFFQISSDVLPLPLEVVAFALPRRARLRGDDAAAEAVVAPPAAAPEAGGLNISANCSTLKLLVGPALLPSINWCTKSSFIESWPVRPPRDAPRVGIVRGPPSRSLAVRAFGKPRAVSVCDECVRARGERGACYPGF
jgi:hypothetical protein